jgi:hypothetical protein
MKSLPLEDDWGHAFRYWSNGTQYLIMSAGEDGREDLSYDAAVQMTPKVLMKRACRGPMSEASSDIVFADGAFCTYPEAAADAEESAPEE